LIFLLLLDGPDSSGRDGTPGTWISGRHGSAQRNNINSDFSDSLLEETRLPDPARALIGLVVWLLDNSHIWCIVIVLFMRPVTSPVLVHIIGRRVMGLGSYRAWIMVLITLIVLAVIGLAGGLTISSKFIGLDSAGQGLGPLPRALQVELLSRSLNGFLG